MKKACWLGILLLLPTLVSAQPPVTALAYAPNGQSLLVGSQDGTEVYQLPELKRVRRLSLDLPHIHCLAFSPDGQQLAVAGGRPAEFGELILCRWPSGQIQWRRTAHDDVIYDVAWNDQGDQLATASGDQIVMTLEAESGQVQQRLVGHSRPVLAVRFLPGGTQVVSAGIDRSLRVWDTTTASVVRQLDNHTDDIRALARRPGEHGLPMLASIGADHTVRFWQPTIGRLVRFIKLPVEPLSIAWGPSGQYVVVGCIDGHVRTIDHETLDVVADRAVIDGWVYEVATSRDGLSVAAGGSQHHVVQLNIEDVQRPASGAP